MLLKRSFWWFWLILNILTGGISTLFLGKLLNVYEKNAWYTKWYYWFLGIFFMILPALIMLIVLIIEVTVKVCLKLDVPFKNIYKYPYPWLLGIIIPVIGWAFFVILVVYVNLFYAIKLLEGNGEKFIK